MYVYVAFVHGRDDLAITRKIFHTVVIMLGKYTIDLPS
jgi:hypothetical protein